MKTKTKKSNSDATHTVHFTIGEDGGILLMNIAQEKVLYSYNPQKAIEVLTDSLAGCQINLALKILKGDVVLTVDVKEQVFLATDRIPELHDKIFPKLNCREWAERQAKDICVHALSLGAAIRKMKFDAKYKMSSTRLTVTFNEILDFVNGNEKSIINKIREDENVDTLSNLVTRTKQFIKKSLKIQSVIGWMRKTYPEDFTGDFEGSRLNQASPDLTFIMREFQSLLSGENFIDVIKQDTALDAYIDASLEIDRTIKKGIEPVNILDNWSAGWLSPDGEYYGLNGEIANMLHIQIADALQEKGIIPKKDEDGEVNTDAWLEQEGWVKIHGNNINFGGCLNDKATAGKKPNVNMTEKQISIIYKYGMECCNCVFRMGWKQEQMTAAMFEMFASNNPERLNEKCFKF